MVLNCFLIYYNNLLFLTIHEITKYLLYKKNMFNMCILPFIKFILFIIVKSNDSTFFQKKKKLAKNY